MAGRRTLSSINLINKKLNRKIMSQKKHEQTKRARKKQQAESEI